jgi:hypothetical protein
MSLRLPALAWLLVPAGLSALAVVACSDGDSPVVPAGDGGAEATSDAPADVVVPPDAAPDVVDAGPVDALPDAPVDASLTCVVADAVNGNDTNPGTEAKPVKRLTYAIKLVQTPGCITLKPGLYDDKVNGEVFPLDIPPNVTITGDEKNKGMAQNAQVRIEGTLPGNTLPMQGMLQPGAGSVLAGVSIGFTGQTFRVPIYLTAPGVTLRNDTIDHCTAGSAVYVGTGGKNYVITGNDIYKNSGVGLAMILGGEGSKVEGNFISTNKYGIEVDVIPNADFGGGAQGSLGNNVITCNATQDFWTVQTNGVLSVKNNQWDHQPPTIGAGTGDDVYKASNNGASVDTTGAKLAPNPCP